ncbi:hypothetical protein ACEN9H_11915 [Massilia cellulosiltytica]|uniref:hypothetical protein n=1 Tax=Massilia cellulosiltytica TaxID=2683234 RepID=UPI0039B536BC
MRGAAGGERAAHAVDGAAAAAGLHVWPFVLFFVPYYFLAVAALFVHVGCALRRGRAVAAGFTCAGLTVAGLLVATSMGQIVPVEIPARYLATFAGQ